MSIGLEVLMRAFYEACERIMESKRRDDAIDRLHKAQAIMQPIVDQAKSRLELRLVADLDMFLQYAAQWIACVFDVEAGGKWPGCGPMEVWGYGSTFVYPPIPRKEGGSLKYRWGAARERPETALPQVAMRSGWPVDRLDEATIEFARSRRSGRSCTTTGS